MKKKLFLLGVIGLLMPFNISALSGNVSLSCDKAKLNAGESTTCTIKGSIEDGSVSSVNARVELGENLSLVSVDTDSSWQGDGEDGNIELYTDDNKNGEFNIGTVVVKAGNSTGVSTSVSLKDVVLYDAAFKEQSLEVNSFAIRVLSKENTLKDLKINGNTINGFKSDKTDYSIELDESEISISALSNDESANVTGDIGNKKLVYGENKFTITVTSESGSKKNYTVTINKPEIRELKKLKVNGMDFGLQKGLYEYDMIVLDDLSSISFEAELLNENVKFVDGFGPRKVDNLIPGKNAILIKVVDNNGDVLTYTIYAEKLVSDEDDKIEIDEDKNTNVNGNKEEIKNPNTGINVSLTVGFILSLIIIISYVILRKKNYFNKI